MIDPLAGPARAAPSAETEPLRAAAQALEAVFLSEMLKAAGYGEARSAFGGGAGEAQFASFLRDAHAEALTERGGLGLAEAIFKSMTEAAHGTDGHH
ncbi:rod-binding protein [Ovoidimarina sediminis]|uniref:rod-binding protein n=1 Tax=Ovoidimarina sediminis TaxID=3079856 RepID=UPI0029100F5A|nr:rod-binding protein [Rhodophyticola sp. MJ-SS7]MDU8942581.1 rod-binding protein [Rhodophyticola sp. MJ-SS7]